MSSFFRDRTAADRDALLSAQEWRLFIGFQVDKASVIQRLAFHGLVVGQWI